MIMWDLSPVFATIGPLQLRWYGLTYALGFLLAMYVLRNAGIKGLSKKLADDYVFLLIMGSIVAARLFYVVVYNPVFYLHNPLEIPAVWHGGLSIHGGLIGAVLVTWTFCRKHGVNFYDIADTLVLPLALAMVLTRMANFANAELYGTATGVPWCVNFPGVDGCRHPSQAYEALYSYALFLVLLALRESRRVARGVLFWSFVGLYGLFRFLVTFYRQPDPTDPVLLGLAIGQWLSLGMLLLSGWWFFEMRRTGHPLTR